ncbi:MAG TPA: hypothetical protein VKE22_00160 [Haliangiales bacterium]|nr:hypothetical protein [Haliangiales bacterium]
MHFHEKERKPGTSDPVSVWDHVKNGAATGVEAGGLGGPLGLIPGLIGGGIFGLANGLWDKYEEHEDRDMWRRTMGPELRALDDQTAAKAKGAITPDQERAIWAKEDEMEEQWFQLDRNQRKYANGEKEGWLDRLF